MGEGVARGRGQLVLRWERWRRELSDVVAGELPWSEKRGKVFAQIAEKKGSSENIPWQERQDLAVLAATDGRGGQKDRQSFLVKLRGGRVRRLWRANLDY
jgi:hypothetical protein